ncbi:hypothetical protein EON76_05270 [bacterium]|nr:MAG: hypothetical protein EON76_05270 [bacterium]
MAAHYDFERMRFNHDETWMSCYHNPPGRPPSGFDWSETPQGFEFWQTKGHTKEGKDVMACMLMLHKLLREGP